MYSRSAQFYDLMYSGKDYARAADVLRSHIAARVPDATNLLDVGCGTGRHLEHLQSTHAVEGLDLSPDLLAVARDRCPRVPMHEGDMVELDLVRRFDVVTCLFSAIGFVRTPDRLRRAISRMAAHLRPGGLLVVEPWFTPQTYWHGHVVADFHDTPHLKLARMYVQGGGDGIYAFDFQFLAADARGVEHLVERHELGLFSDEEYRDAVRASGLRVEHDTDGLFDRGLYFGIAPPPAPE